MLKKHLVLIGLKHAGKTTIGKILAQKAGRLFVDTDLELEKNYYITTQKHYSFAKIYQLIGEAAYRECEQRICKELLAQAVPSVIAFGGSTLLQPSICTYLQGKAIVIYLQAKQETLLKRWKKSPPGFIKQQSLELALKEYYQRRAEIYRKKADIVVSVDNQASVVLAHKIYCLLVNPL